jgi:S1-C subfamily serine protease
MDDIKILEAVERYINGQMTTDERVYFETLRKSSPEIDQLVVEHTFFLHQMDRFDETRKLKSVLDDIHIDMAEKGAIEFPRLKGKAKVVYLFNKYKRVSTIAASIAGITALTFSALVWSISPNKPAKKEDVVELKRDFDKKLAQVHRENKVLNQKIDNVTGQTTATENIDPIEYTGGGTGFLISTKGLLVTNAHVVKDAKHVAIQDNEGKDLKAEIVHLDLNRDIAILKITDKRFKEPNAIPYGIKRSGGDLAEPIFTLGYPRNDIVYGDGYIAAKTGYNGDTLACQIAIAANRGNSGSPVLNKKGEVIAVISNKQNTAEGAVFAIRSKYIYEALNDLQAKDTTYKKLHISNSSNLKEKDRTQQVNKIANYVYMVKVN